MNYDEDPLAAPRGIFNGCIIIAAPFWIAVIIVVIWLVTR